MYTEDEVRELLEQAYSKGFDSGVEDTLDYMDENYDMEEFFEEETSYDLEDGAFDLIQESDKYYRQDRGGKGYLNDPSGKWRYKASDDAMKQQGKFDNFKKRASSGQKVEKIKAQIKSGKNVNTNSFNRKVDKYNSNPNHKYSELNRYDD